MDDCVAQFYEKLRDDASLRDCHITATADERRVITLEGEVDVWQKVVDIGHLAAKCGVKGVVNRVTSKDAPQIKKDRTGEVRQAEAAGVIDRADVVIIGAGITGSGIARTLAKYNKRIIVVEKASDVSEGTSKSNNGMIHSGYDSKPGSLKALLNVKGNAMYTQWQEELNFKMNRRGSFVVGFDESDDAYLEQYYELGKKNGVPGIAILSGDEARAIEPALSHDVARALWTPSAAFVEPYEVVEALMENAIDNGVQLMLNTEVLGFKKDGSQLSGVITDKGVIETGCVINAAGLYADEIAELAGDRFYTIHPRRGTLVILDKKIGKTTNKCFVGTPPKNFTKGGGPTQTPEGNPLWGPSAIEVPEKDDMAVDEDDVRFVMEKGMHLTEGASEKDIITYFSGCRASNYIEDFVIEASEVTGGFIHAACIQSPGLASGPAIAERVEGIYTALHPEAAVREDYDPIRPEHKAFRDCTLAEKEALIAKNPLYGHVICRCETITEAEIVDAIHGKIPATTVDAVKRRTRAGMGRCQGGFCGPRVVEIIARELGIAPEKVTKRGAGSEMLTTASRKGEEA